MTDAGLALSSRCAMTLVFEFVYILGRYINVRLLLLLSYQQLNYDRSEHVILRK